MHYIYILENEGKQHYIGHTEDIELRLTKHNSNSVRSTKNKGPWKIIYKETFNTKTEAYRREMEIKRYKGGNAFRRLIGKNC